LARSTEINGNLMSKLLPLKLFKSLLGYFVVLNLSFFLLIHLISPKATAQETVSRAYVIKAGFIYNFTKFILWPAKSNPHKRIHEYKVCVIGENPFGSLLHRLAEKHRLKEHPLEIKLDVSPGEFKECHILFISFSERFNVEKIIEQVGEWPVLILGDSPGYTERGVDINLLIVENKVTFEINQRGLEEKGFRVSSELLELATLVSGGPRQ